MAYQAINASITVGLWLTDELRPSAIICLFFSVTAPQLQIIY